MKKPKKDRQPTSERVLAAPDGMFDAVRACRLYGSCNANLCPLDPDLGRRTWMIGEEVCNLPEHRQLAMIRRQRQLNRLRSESYMGMALEPEWLAKTARAKRELSEEQRTALVARLSSGRIAIS